MGEEKERMRRYNIALQKANKSLEANLALNSMLNELDGDVNEDEDEQFHATLQRAEKLKEKSIAKSSKNEPTDTAMEEDIDDGKQEGVVCIENVNENEED